MNPEESLFDSSHSVTHLIQQLKEADPQAAEQIWRRYFQRLLPLARAKLNALPHKVVDEEDILVSVFDRFFRAADEDRFARLHDRDDLWQILLLLTERKVADQYRQSATLKRGGAKVAAKSDSSETDFNELHRLIDREPGPEYLAAFNEHLARAMTRLKDEKTREVALLRMEGYPNREIADQIGISLTSVERKMRVIRDVWRKEFSA